MKKDILQTSIRSFGWVHCFEVEEKVSRRNKWLTENADRLNG